MNILAVPSFYGLSSPKAGGQNRFSNLLIELKRNGNNIFLLESEAFFCSEDTELAKVYTFKENKIFNREFSTTKDFNPDFISKIAQILKYEKIDLIQFSHLSGIFAVRLILKLSNKKIPIVYDAHNVESDFVFDVIGKSFEYSKLSRILIPIYIRILETISCKYLVDHITCVSSNDQLVFLNRYGLTENKVSVISSGCRVPQLKNKDRIKTKIDVGFEPDKLVVFFHGSFSHPPNKEAFTIIENQIAPKFKEYNNVLFILGGSGTSKYKRQNVESIGTINNLHETIYASDIAIVPLTAGGGTKLKIFDYLSMNLPIVTTEKGAEGIDLEDHINAIICKNVDESFTESLKFLLENESVRLRLGNNARKLAEEKYDWKKIGNKLNNLYFNILELYR